MKWMNFWFLCLWLLGSCCYAQDAEYGEDNKDIFQFIMNPYSEKTLIDDLKLHDFKKARKDIFGDSTDRDIPDWFVYAGDDVPIQGFDGKNFEKRNGKYSYFLKDKQYIYLILIVKNNLSSVPTEPVSIWGNVDGPQTFSSLGAGMPVSTYTGATYDPTPTSDSALDKSTKNIQLALSISGLLSVDLSCSRIGTFHHQNNTVSSHFNGQLPVTFTSGIVEFDGNTTLAGVGNPVSVTLDKDSAISFKGVWPPTNPIAITTTGKICFPDGTSSPVTLTGSITCPFTDITSQLAAASSGVTTSVSVTSLQRYISASQSIFDSVIGKVDGGYSDSGNGPSTIYSTVPVNLWPLDSQYRYYAAITRLPVNPESQNRLTLNFPPQMSESGKIPQSVINYFETRDTWPFGASVALATGLEPWSPGESDDFFTHLQNIQADFLLHYYPFEDDPFDISFFKSANLFIGTPVVGTSGASLSTVYFGGGFANAFGQDVGLILGYGWNFGANRSPDMIFGLDFKL